MILLDKADWKQWTRGDREHPVYICLVSRHRLKDAKMRAELNGYRVRTFTRTVSAGGFACLIGVLIAFAT